MARSSQRSSILIIAFLALCGVLGMLFAQTTTVVPHDSDSDVSDSLKQFTEVYDIETEKYHTFFANGFAVHNCQDLNLEFVPQIRETLRTSDYRWENYFGTARGVENTIQVLFDESSGGEWFMKCPRCGLWIC